MRYVTLRVPVKIGLPVGDAHWTSLQGYVEATYAHLVSVLGAPDRGSDDRKTDAEWRVSGGGVVATIYNYKNGPAYRGPEGTPVEAIAEWNVGGNSELALQLVGQLTGCPVRGWQ